ncbi:MAG: acyl-CoA synthetase [Variovorax sp.]|nr:MAG: acyl-CoA synthetase [Variovorax sp.]
MNVTPFTARPTDPVELPSSTYALLQAAAGQFGDAPALTYIRDAAAFHSAETLSFRELLAKVTQAANLFHSVGVDAGKVVAYALPNLPETHFALWGAEAAGIAMAINPALPGEQAADLLRAAGARVLVTMASAGPGDFLASIAPHLDSCPSLTHVFLVGDDPAPALPGLTMTRFGTAMDIQRGDALVSGRMIRPDEPSSWFCTGGTTGAPKIARRTHGSEVANARMVEIALAGHAGPGRNFFCGLPLFHANAAIVTGLVPWLAGSHVVCGPANGYRDRAVIANFWALVEAYRINVFSGVPTIFGALLQQPVNGHDLSSLDFAICGAAPMPVELFNRFEAATGIRILEGYGLTESACVASFNPIDGERRIGSIGQALPWQKMKCVILDESGSYVREAATDEVGIIALAGPNIFEGYNSAGHNATAWIDCHDEERWFNTGDLGRRDAEGYFWLTGRKKDLIIRGGHNIDPATIEEPLLRHPDIALAAAIGQPDAHAGEVPVAYVQLRDGAAADENELLAFATRSIGERAAVPKAVHIIAQMPLTAVGKLFKPALVIREIEDVVRREAAGCGVAVGTVDVTIDPKRGMVAQVRTRGSALPLRAALGRYTFAAEFTEA